VLCAILNSYIANFLVRLRVTTHVTLAVMNWLPVPRPPSGSALYVELLRSARVLTDNPADPDAFATLHAAAASAYGVTEQELAHVLASFPLVPRADRAAVLERFRAGLGDGIS
jgi:hypothetical protein